MARRFREKSLKKAAQAQEEVAIDRMDAFIKRNYKAIILVALAIIITFLVIYGVYSVIESGKRGKLKALGLYESQGLYLKGQVDSYVKLSESMTFAKDYIHYNAGVQYLALGSVEEGLEQLNMSSGEFAEYAQSLLYDVSGNKVMDTTYLEGKFSPVWYYRAILAAPEGERAELIAKFEKVWANSLMLGRIKAWGIN